MKRQETKAPLDNISYSYLDVFGILKTVLRVKVTHLKRGLNITPLGERRRPITKFKKKVVQLSSRIYLHCWKRQPFQSYVTSSPPFHPIPSPSQRYRAACREKGPAGAAATPGSGPLGAPAGPSSLTTLYQSHLPLVEACGWKALSSRRYRATCRESGPAGAAATPGSAPLGAPAARPSLATSHPGISTSW